MPSCAAPSRDSLGRLLTPKYELVQKDSCMDDLFLDSFIVDLIIFLIFLLIVVRQKLVFGDKIMYKFVEYNNVTNVTSS